MIRSLLVVAAALLASPTAAQTFPDRPIKLVVSSAAGGGADLLVRFIAAKMQPLAGQPVVVENKPGANGNIANDYVANAKPDGYTVLFAASSAIIANRYVMKDVTYDAMKDFEPVGSVFRVGMVLTVPPNSPYKTVADLVSALKTKQSKILYGVPTTSVLGGSALFKIATGTNGEAVNYKSMLDASRDVSSGDIDYSFLDTTLGVAQERAGRLKVLAATTPTRLEAAPNVPTMKEAGIKDYEYINFWGVWLPAKTPSAIAQRLNGWLGEVIKSPEGKKFIADNAGEIWLSTPQELRAQMIEHDKLWQRIVKDSGITPQ
ncbi:tripartite tricarboxylate transporter substrate binding protein [Roseiarcaceae bacterium H3SJ34-1]|uniref:Bug family tripartite tricarboxylate transporter substrate binding protein n=1 Tax=Terripilifer ovatus TaxID=3032367 RepID=UPI003AB942CD|nr:tripartite tricarboxylate transporter substrate binding protein [Roseiarcaceae bacterium H3SJ34-1]